MSKYEYTNMMEKKTIRVIFYIFSFFLCLLSVLARISFCLFFLYTTLFYIIAH